MKKFFLFLAFCLLAVGSMRAEAIVYNHCPVTTDEEYPNFKTAELVHRNTYVDQNFLTLLLYSNSDWYWDVQTDDIAFGSKGNGKYLALNFEFEDLYDLAGSYSTANHTIYNPDYDWVINYDKQNVFSVDAAELRIEWSADRQTYNIYYWYKCNEGTNNEVEASEWVYGICPVEAPGPKIYGEFSGDGKTFTLYYDSPIPGGAINMDVYELPWFSSGRYDNYVEERKAVETIVLDESMKNARPERTDYWFSGFENATAIKNLAWLNTGDVFEMAAMFQNCKSLKALDLSHFETGNCQWFPNLFENCKKLEKIDLSHFNTAKAVNTYSMFDGCTSLTYLDMRNCDWSNVTFAKYMFGYCENLETIYSSQDLSQYTEMDGENMFFRCAKLKGGNGTQCDGEFHVDTEYARPDRDGQPGYFSEIAEGVENVNQEPKAESRKLIVNGQLLIERHGRLFNALGAEQR